MIVPGVGGGRRVLAELRRAGGRVFECLPLGPYALAVVRHIPARSHALRRRALRLGCHWLRLSADGEEFTRYPAEAGIAAEHCLAPSFAAVRWREIERLYLVLNKLAPLPLHTLNRAIAVAQARGPRRAWRS